MSVDPRAGSNSTSLSSEDDYHFFYKFMVGTKLNCDWWMTFVRMIQNSLNLIWFIKWVSSLLIFLSTDINYILNVGKHLLQQLLMPWKPTLYHKNIEFSLKFRIKRIQSGSQFQDKNVSSTYRKLLYFTSIK